jgi:hypothetical protein
MVWIFIFFLETVSERGVNRVFKKINIFRLKFNMI